MEKACELCGAIMVGVTTKRRFCPNCMKVRQKLYYSNWANKHKKPPVDKPIASNSKHHPCYGCIHWRTAMSNNMCHYIFDVGHSRGCLPGKDCTVKNTNKRRKNNEG